MKKILCIFALMSCVVSASAQISKIPQRNELAQVEINDGTLTLEVFNSPKDGVNNYYLSVGHLGIGDDIVQVQIDPVSELFIPLGHTLAESVRTLEELKALYKEAPGSSIEVDGNLAVGFPKENLEKVTVTHRKVMLSHMLEFSVARGQYIRATHISKSDFGSIVSSVKMYRRIHPKEK